MFGAVYFGQAYFGQAYPPFVLFIRAISGMTRAIVGFHRSTRRQF